MVLREADFLKAAGDNQLDGSEQGGQDSGSLVRVNEAKILSI
jgi:hypothetical protein